MSGVDVHTHLAPLGVPHAGPPGLADPDGLEAHLDAAGLDGAIVTVPPPYYRQELGTDDSVDWAAELNQGLLARLEGRPRLRGLAFLPLHDPAAALRAYQEIRDDPAWLGVVAGAGGRCPSLADKEYAALWHALDTDRRALMLHPAESPDPRLAEFYLANLLGNPVETAVAAAQLVFGNVLARHPEVRVVLVHGGGVVPSVAARWARGAETARPGLPAQDIPVRQAVRRFWVDCLTHDPVVTGTAVEIFGADKILLGSDWPFPMGTSLVEDAPVAGAGTANAAAAFGWTGSAE
ncbi:amidohydrolase family protein [Phytohabitans rumicis]|uniref:2-hydroxy-3-carboxy-6-oxo-7-methylocta-2,4-dienoa te decarboxylase n=1 Tax=Phytohabitans rumicis TaxID=1076125 RepID=A0A6V8KSY2_9ACTN|nr:amidohydrolase family protein [Phytohabitans rumicis]GFJ88252.1 2-hydroxy-3-carboxy-6-oxo-7-methylocta-2,4-dienoa te decarboxylase [Phytohabitans rumicis]